jgi:hypothetical protein
MGNRVANEQTKIAPDFSYVRDGVGLADCLRQLVSDDPDVRHVAGERVQAMYYGLPSIHTDFAEVDTAALQWGSDAHEAESYRVVSAAVGKDDFDLIGFARRLCAMRIAFSRDYYRRGEEMKSTSRLRGMPDPRPTAVTQVDVDVDAISDVAHRELWKLVSRYTETSLAREIRNPRPYLDAEHLAPTGLAAGWIFSRLGSELLAAPEGLTAMLAEPKLRPEALEAIDRAGPAAISFASRFLAELDALPRETDNMHRYFDAYRALGSVSRGHPTVIDALLARLDHPDASIRQSVAFALRHADGKLCGRNAAAVEKLQRAWATPEGLPEVLDLQSLASIGRDDAAIRARVASQLQLQQAPLAADNAYPRERYNWVMVHRGYAIEATAYLTAYPGEFVPLLIEAMETFEEYDEDEGHNGACERIARALGRFGPGAAAAAVPLALWISRDRDGDFPRAILDALGKIGPAARDALPLLDAYRRATAGDEPLADLYSGPIDPIDDLVGATMQRIMQRITQSP